MRNGLPMHACMPPCQSHVHTESIHTPGLPLFSLAQDIVHILLASASAKFQLLFLSPRKIYDHNTDT